ncbi:hypothetical protein FIBSPDRAFT_25739, partial [Athelia psychrophila]
MDFYVIVGRPWENKRRGGRRRRALGSGTEWRRTTHRRGSSSASTVLSLNNRVASCHSLLMSHVMSLLHMFRLHVSRASHVAHQNT